MFLLGGAAQAQRNLPGQKGGNFMQTLGLGFTWEQLSPGQRFRTLNRTVTETDLVMFTGVTGMLGAFSSTGPSVRRRARSKVNSYRRR
jgi:hypothetical protein